MTATSNGVSYLVFDVEAVADGNLVSKVRYAKDNLGAADAIQRYREELLAETGRDVLPPTFMLLQPVSWHPDVWTDITRMRTLNMLQERQGKELHLCPLQIELVDRLITQFSMPGETVYEHPFLWGSRRIGPDLAPVGGKYPDLWHLRHFENPRAISPKSMMPSYGHLITRDLDFDGIQRRVDAMAMLGVPYGDAVNNAPALAREQAQRVAAAIVQGGGEPGLEHKEIVALIAYVQRLGRDIQGPAPVVTAPAAPSHESRVTSHTPGGGR